MNKKYILGLGGIVAVVALLGFALEDAPTVRSSSQPGIPPPSGRPNYPQFNPFRTTVPHEMASVVAPKRLDLSQNTSELEKVSVIVRNSNESREMFLPGPEIDVDRFIKHLPVGDRLIQVLPPPFLMMSQQIPILAREP